MLKAALAAKRVMMKQSLLEAPPLIPALKDGLPIRQLAPAFWLAVVASVIALATSIVALTYALAR